MAAVRVAWRVPSGHSVIELMFVAALVITLTSIAVPVTASVVDNIHASGASRYLVTRLRLARLEAVKRSTAVGFRFVERSGRYEFRMYVDGNGDGVRTRDITRGVDPPVGGVERLRDHFSNVEFGVLPGVPPIDEPSDTSASDPIRFGASNIVSFSPTGSASSGTLYFKGRGNQQYAVRVLGVTGRVRSWRFDQTTRTWNPR